VASEASSEAPEGAAEEAPETVPSVWNIRTYFVFAIAAALVLCLGGVFFGYYKYNELAEPDRDTPALAVDQYLSARLTDRDEVRANVFTCKSSTLGSVDQLVRDITAREQQYGITIRVTSSDLAISSTTDRASVDANLKIDVPEQGGQSSRSIQRWHFDVVNQDGWRVCAANRVS